METFIQLTAQDIIRRFGTNLRDITVVFPNKRAGLFMNQQLAAAADRPVWAPRYSTISELFDYYYLPEFDHYRREIERELRSSSRRLTYDAGRMEMQPIVDAFYEKPLDEMRPLNPRPRTREEFRRQIGTLAARLQRM